MRTIFKLSLGFGLLSLAAWSMPACGGSSDSGSGGKAGGGTGGTAASGGTSGTGGATGGTGGATGGTGGATGGTGGATGGTGGGSDAGPINCGSDTCQPYTVLTYTLLPCCATTAADKCGADVSDQIGGVLGVPAGCYELNQAGNLDSNCPPLSVGGVSLPGCCNAATSKCGWQVNASPFGGPNFGCMDTTGVPDAGNQSCTPGEGGVPDASSDGATDAGNDASDASSD